MNDGGDIYEDLKIYTQSVHNHGRTIKEAIFFKWINTETS